MKTLKSKLFFYVFFLMLRNSSVVFSQPRFYKTFDNSVVSYESMLVKTPDDGWLTACNNNGIDLIRFDKCGVKLWSKHYTAFESMVCADIIANAHGGFTLTGYYGVVYVPGTSPFIIRLDDNGNIIYCKVYQDPTYNFIYSVGEDQDGNLFVNGNTNSGGVDFGNNFILKTDSLGTIIWSKLFAMGGYWGYALVCTDGGVLRCGGLGNVYKTDASGNVIWSISGAYGANYKPVEVSDGYIFPVYGSAYAFKLDKLSSLVWTSNKYSSSSYAIQSAVALPDDGVAIATNSLLIELDKNGNYKRFNHLINPANMTTPGITDICFYNNNSFVITGFDSKQFVARVDSMLLGCADVNLPIDTLPPPVLAISNNSFSVGAKTFLPVNATISAVDFDPLEFAACSQIDSLNFTLSAPPAICVGESTSLSLLTSYPGNDATWNWYAGSCGGTPAGQGSALTVSPSSTQVYFVQGTNACDTSACKAVNVSVKETPVADFSTEYKTSCEGVRLNITNQSANADTYNWTLSDGFTSADEDINHFIDPSQPLSITLIAANINSCRDTMTIQNSFTSFGDYLNIIIPNIFTPNEDGTNDSYKIITDSDLSNCYHLNIYDRWGILIYSTDKYNSEWDGRTSAGAKVVAGTYFYFLNVNDVEYNGEITLAE